MAVFLAVSGLSAQQAPERWRVLDADVRLPVPGVALTWSTMPRVLRPDGWIALDDHDRLFRLPADAPRSDPEGYLECAPREGGGHLRASAPFTVEGFDAVDGQPVVLVRRQEQYNVLVVDVQGRALPDFPVALVSSRRQVAVAWSDARGHATLAMPPGHEARVTVVPAGWIGPIDAFPTVARQFSRARVRLVVPPHGSLRLAVTRHGREARAVIRSFWCTSPHYAARTHGEDAAPALGVELGRIALGQQIHCGVDADRRRFDLVVAGPTHAGQVVTHRVELADPAPPAPVRSAGQHPSRYANFAIRLTGADRILARQLEGCLFDARGREMPFRPYEHEQRDPELLFVNVMVWEHGPHTVTLRLHGVELGRIEGVPLSERPPRDDEPLAFDVTGRCRTVSCRFVDSEGVPVEGVWLSFFARERTGYVLSDRAGRVEFALPVDEPPRMLAWSQAIRSRDVTDPRHGDDLVVEPAARWPVSIRGLPEELPARHYALELCPVDGLRFEAICRATLAAGEEPALAVPMRGRYWLQLVEVIDPHAHPLVCETIVRWPHELDFGAAVPAAVTLQLDEPARERLRQSAPASRRQRKSER